ncbi:MAG: ParB/RepB/Spo0J family partition protein [Candidatus Binatia bacterium]
MQKKGLGRGLGALIPDVDLKRDTPNFQVAVGKIASNPFQPRHVFDEAKIDELAASVRDTGILQPLLVRRSGDGYELIAGERRLRAALKSGLREVPVIVREASDNESFQLALIENLQRENLNPIEEANAFQRFQKELDWSQEEIAGKVGRSRSAIANSMRLLLLPEEVQQEVACGKLPVGQARALLALEGNALIISMARKVITKGLSTRETERLVNRLKPGRRSKRGASVTDPEMRSLTETLQRSLGTKVRIAHHAKSGRGKIEIEYYCESDLERIIQVMGGSKG